MSIPRPYRIADSTAELVKKLAEQENQSQGQIIDKAIAAYAAGPQFNEDSAKVDHLLMLVQSLPDAGDIETLVESTMRRVSQELYAERQQSRQMGFNPASVPGVQVGARNLPAPRRESAVERAQRERLERQQRIEASDHLAKEAERDDIVRDDEFVSG